MSKQLTTMSHTSEREVWPKYRVSPRGPRVKVPGGGECPEQVQGIFQDEPNASKASSSSAVSAGTSFDGGESPDPDGEDMCEAHIGISALSHSRGWGSSETAACMIRKALSKAFDRVWSWSIFFLSSSTSATACLWSAPSVYLKPNVSMDRMDAPRSLTPGDQRAYALEC